MENISILKKIGFVGLGFVGGNYADNFEERGYNVMRYSLESNYIKNKENIKECDLVFICVPTPTSKDKGFDFSAVRESLYLVSPGKIAVIKSTILPGTTDALQKEFSDILIVHSPEFLTEKNARQDADKPKRNILGIVDINEENLKKVNSVLSVMPYAPYNKIMLAKEAELIKYLGNSFLYEKIVFFNQAYDLCTALGIDYENVREAVAEDIRIGNSHTQVLHTSNSDKLAKRGAGGSCFVKDYEALIQLYSKCLPEDKLGLEKLKAIRNKNTTF